MTMSDAIVVMRNGRIQQLGTPHDLYERPRNRFVAEFIGQSNSISGRLSEPARDGAASVVTTTGVVLNGRITDPEAVPAADAHVIVAIRPERIQLQPGDGAVPGAGWTVVDGRIRQGTYLGDASEYRVETPLGVLIARQHHDAGAGVQAGLVPGSAVVARWRDDANLVLVA